MTVQTLLSSDDNVSDSTSSRLGSSWNGFFWKKLLILLQMVLIFSLALFLVECNEFSRVSWHSWHLSISGWVPYFNTIIISISCPKFFFFSKSIFSSPTDASESLLCVFLYKCWFDRETELIPGPSWAMIVYLASEINNKCNSSCCAASETFCVFLVVLLTTEPPKGSNDLALNCSVV